MSTLQRLRRQMDIIVSEVGGGGTASVHAHIGRLLMPLLLLLLLLLL